MSIKIKSVRVEESVWDKLEAEAARRGMTLADVIEERLIAPHWLDTTVDGRKDWHHEPSRR